MRDFRRAHPRPSNPYPSERGCPKGGPAALARRRLQAVALREGLCGRCHEDVILARHLPRPRPFQRARGEGTRYPGGRGETRQLPQGGGEKRGDGLLPHKKRQAGFPGLPSNLLLVKVPSYFLGIGGPVKMILSKVRLRLLLVKSVMVLPGARVSSSPTLVSMAGTAAQIFSPPSLSRRR